MSGTLDLTVFTRDDRDRLMSFLSAEPWPFHSGPPPTPAHVGELIDAGYFDGSDTETWWLSAQGGVCGFMRLFDLADDSPMFDVRLAESARGAGLGTAAVHDLTSHVFATRECVRIEATTRRDNVAMRTVLTRCGYVKKAHYRRAWPTAGGLLLDAVGYAILRSDWCSRTTTPVDWEG